MYIDQKAVLAAASGQWSSILPRIAPELADAVQRAPKHVKCPVHHGKDGFRLFNDFEQNGGGACNTCGSKAGGISLLMWVLGIPFKDTLHLVAQEVGLLHDQKVQPVRRKVDPKIQQRIATEIAKRNKKIEVQLQKLWESTLRISAPEAEPARLYFCRRGLDYESLPPGFVRFLPELPYYNEDGDLVGKMPAILSRYVDKNKKGITLHRTYLTENGKKANVEKPKKMCPYSSIKKMAGGSVWLGNIQKTIAVTEGLETGMAVQAAINVSTFVCTNASMLSAFEPPEGVEEICIFADLDFTPSKNGVLTPGQDAGLKLKERLIKQGLKAWVFVPTLNENHQEACDWLDAYNRYGSEGFKDPLVRKEI